MLISNDFFFKKLIESMGIVMGNNIWGHKSATWYEKLKFHFLNIFFFKFYPQNIFLYVAFVHTHILWPMIIILIHNSIHLKWNIRLNWICIFFLSSFSWENKMYIFLGIKNVMKKWTLVFEVRAKELITE